MASIGIELQTAIYSRLTGFAALTALVGGGTPRIYDHVPDNGAAFPYVTIGESTAIPFDTKDTLGSEDIISIHVWSRYKGKKEVKQILGEIYNALHRYILTLPNHVCVDCLQEMSEVYQDDDKTYNGIARYRVTTQAN